MNVVRGQQLNQPLSDYTAVLVNQHNKPQDTSFSLQVAVVVPLIGCPSSKIVGNLLLYTPFAAFSSSGPIAISTKLSAKPCPTQIHQILPPRIMLLQVGLLHRHHLRHRHHQMCHLVVFRHLTTPKTQRIVIRHIRLLQDT